MMVRDQLLRVDHRPNTSWSGRAEAEVSRRAEQHDRTDRQPQPIQLELAHDHHADHVAERQRDQHFPAQPHQLIEADSVGVLATVLKIGVLLTKVFCVIVLIMLLRWCLPRFRFDQLMGLCWKVLIPLSLGNMVCVMVVREFELNWLWLPVSSIVLFCTAGYLGFRPAAPRQTRPMMHTEQLVASHH